jgi:RNA recognition motif-containing protein
VVRGDIESYETSCTEEQVYAALIPQRSHTIYLSGLPLHMTAAELVEMCRPFGDVVAARVERDPETGAPWRFGFVEFQLEDSALRAAATLHGKKFRGDVLAARPLSSSDDSPNLKAHSNTHALSD